MGIFRAEFQRWKFVVVIVAHTNSNAEQPWKVALCHVLPDEADGNGFAVSNAVLCIERHRAIAVGHVNLHGVGLAHRPRPVGIPDGIDHRNHPCRVFQPVGQQLILDFHLVGMEERLVLGI